MDHNRNSTFMFNTGEDEGKLKVRINQHFSRKNMFFKTHRVVEGSNPSIGALHCVCLCSSVGRAHDFYFFACILCGLVRRICWRSLGAAQHFF